MAFFRGGLRGKGCGRFRVSFKGLGFWVDRVYRFRKPDCLDEIAEVTSQGFPRMKGHLFRGPRL